MCLLNIKLQLDDLAQPQRVDGDLRIDLEQVVILGVSGEEIGDADDSTAKRPPVLDAAQILLLPCSHSPYTHTHTHTKETVMSRSALTKYLPLTKLS